MIKEYCKILITSLLYSVSLLYITDLSAQTYGLRFQANEVTLDERTELNLTPDGFINFHDEFELSFDFRAYQNFGNQSSGLFGYIFRIINRENFNVDLLSTPNPLANLNIVAGKDNSILSLAYPYDALNEWIKLKVKFILSEDRMIFYTPDSFYVQNDIGFSRKDGFKIIFGANDYIPFKTTDVPSMCIKDVRIFEKGKLLYHWPLNEVNNTIAVDKVRKRKATIKNPYWLMHSHQSWNKEFQRNIDGPLVFASDVENGRIFMVGLEQLIVYSAINGQIETISYTNPSPFSNDTYRAFYNRLDNKLYCYLAEGEPLWSFDLNTQIWNETSPVYNAPTRYKHHNLFFDAKNNSILIFGGYGFHEYKNEIRKISIDDNSVVNLPTNDSIFRPRYLAGLGELNDTIYILGGYGSESGDQRINPQSYYDLIGYSIKNGSLFRKFEIPRIMEDMTVANTMWIDKITRDYYALVFEKNRFESNLQMVKGNLDSPEITFVGDQIPFQFFDKSSFAGLYYMPQINKLFAYSSYYDDSEVSNVKIYSISYPPNINHVQKKNAEKKQIPIFWYAGIFFLLIVGAVIWFLTKRRSRNLGLKQIKDSQEFIDKGEKNTVLAQPDYQLIFFGGFQVFNKDFEDITNKFSPLLKELFLLIILYSYKNNKGISSEKISEVLWFDKTEKSARNNRSVNIAKLRTILEELGSCELSKKTGYWKIDFKDSGVKSDYADFLSITSSKNNLTKQKVNLLIEITRKGAFLLNVHYEWLDEFKSAVSDKIVDTLVNFAKSCDVKNEADFIVHLADSIFNFDMINEDAMMLKSRAQYCMGKHSHAKATYDKFFKEYVTMYGQEYNKSFLEVLEIKK